ncbi:MAG: hypothetical protein IPK85_04490 [Gemmatimonadetes bacterium]|nr:hypothetical protein [Gemmatimonadota bacterium]
MGALGRVGEPATAAASHPVVLCTIGLTTVPFASPGPGLPIPANAGTPLLTPEASAALILARPGADTVEVGSGLVFDRAAWLRRDPRKIFGQTMQLERIEGAGAERVRRANQERGSREVVLVPWGYDAGCGPYFWRGSAQWSTPDSVGVYVAELRPDSLWSAGRATFDVYVAEISYAYGPHLPHRSWIDREARKHGRVSGPTPQEVFLRNRPVRPP